MSNPDDHDEYVMEAFDYYYADYFAEAEEKFRIAIKHNPENALAWQGYHRALASQGKNTEARSAIQRSLDLNENDAISWFTLAMFLDERKIDTPIAISAYHRGLKLDPSEASIWRNLSVLYARVGDLENSERVIRTALEMWPRSPECLEILEWNLKLQNRIDEATTVKEKIATINAEEKRQQDELDHEIDETIREIMGYEPDDFDDDEDEEIPEPAELNYITKMYEEGLEEEQKDESDPRPLTPNPPHKTDISGFYGEDSDGEEFGLDLFGDDDEESSKDTSESEDEDDGMDGLDDLFFSE
ncbi:tetratricopeptide repeat protein [Candidatus Thorarchaeota archaeon]|nr:MAG: tetratricopeptide repeat protein [Candidatus Thorarchaeota archaeon]